MNSATYKSTHVHKETTKAETKYTPEEWRAEQETEGAPERFTTARPTKTQKSGSSEDQLSRM